MQVDMLFPEGKSKALVLSYDDAPVQDRRLIQLLDQYGLKGTFHLNSGLLGNKGHVRPQEVRTLYAGHEVSAHTVNHPGLTQLTESEIVREVVADREALERLTGKLVRGMSYPFGDHDQFVIDSLRSTGIEYARTVEDSYGFAIPNEFLAWHPTIHQFGTAYYEDSTPERDARELARFFQIVDDFLATEEVALLYVWAHSWEFDAGEDRWRQTEHFFQRVQESSEVCSMTHIDLVDYVKAFRDVKYSADKSMATNLCSIPVFLSSAGRTCRVGAGETVSLITRTGAMK
jgi:peptidoglycan/xylan/chitin deacetylase (PgdA/CDA1 family)